MIRVANDYKTPIKTDTKMGIKLLNKFLKENCRSSGSIYSVHMSKLYGKTIVIDISIYLYKYETDNSLIESIYTMISIFRNYNITPIFIFDGMPPTEKKELIETRVQKKRDAEMEYNKLKQQLGCDSYKCDKNEIIEQMNSLKKNFVYMNKNKINKIKQLLDYYGMTYFDAPGEADQLCALLVINGKAWACLSDDTDLFVYGCNRVLRYFSLLNHTAILYDYDNILKELNITHSVFREICILSGTDYNSGICTNPDLKSSSMFNVIKIMQLYKKYINDVKDVKDVKDVVDNNTESFCNWISNSANIEIDNELLLKMINMFEIPLGDYNDSLHNTIYNIEDKPISKQYLYELLKEEGFLFSSYTV